MNARAIQDTLSSRPFEPLHVILSSGERYLVRHPENVMLLKDRVTIAFYEKEDARPDELPDRSVSVSYFHIAAIEPAPPARRRKRSA